MSVPAASVGRRGGSLAVPILIAVVALAALILLPRLGQSDSVALPVAHNATSTAVSRVIPPFPTRAPAPVWGKDVDAKVRFQTPIDQMPDGAPYSFRVTELAMEPGTKVLDHTQISAGTHVVVGGEITINDVEHGTSQTYKAGQAYFEGLLDPLHNAVNGGAATNRVLMFDLLPAARGFDGTQAFTDKGRHNDGELRSGPYAQVPLRDLPAGPLMLRVTDLSFGPKAKSLEHVTLGPTLYFVQDGTATVRKNWDNSSTTYGTNGYLFEGGKEPYILENKPASPAHFIAVEILPASVGNGPSTIPTED
jgi:hypothetical protein